MAHFIDPTPEPTGVPVALPAPPDVLYDRAGVDADPSLEWCTPCGRGHERRSRAAQCPWHPHLAVLAHGCPACAALPAVPAQFLHGL